MSMPEEVNRVLTDHISSILLCPSQTSADNLKKEGITEGVHVVGDVMADVLYKTVEKHKNDEISLLSKYHVEPGGYLTVTAHRAENTDDPERLHSILAALAELSSFKQVLFPMHPRTRKSLENLPSGALDDLRLDRLCISEPIPYLDMLFLVRNAFALLTDSGGLQKESYWLHTPCLTLRRETEWVETVETGWNHLVGYEKDKIVESVKSLDIPEEHPTLYGDGHTAEKCVETISKSGCLE